MVGSDVGSVVKVCCPIGRPRGGSAGECGAIVVHGAWYLGVVNCVALHVAFFVLHQKSFCLLYWGMQGMQGKVCKAWQIHDFSDAALARFALLKMGWKRPLVCSLDS
jgi:hypothetical protein